MRSKNWAHILIINRINVVKGIYRVIELICTFLPSQNCRENDSVKIQFFSELNKLDKNQNSQLYVMCLLICERSNISPDDVRLRIWRTADRSAVMRRRHRWLSGHR